MSNYFRTTYFPHHDDTWTGNFYPKFYKGIPGATMDDFLTHMDSRYDDVYSYFFEGVDEDGIIDWTDKNLVEDYLDYIQYYYFKEHDCVRAHHRSKCCYFCKHFISNGKNKKFLGSCLYGLEKPDQFPRRHVGNYHAKHGFETCKNFEMKQYYLDKRESKLKK